VETRAAVLRELNRPLSVETIELDPPKEGEVLIRLVAAGICHSDHHFVTGHRQTRLPTVKGHEGAGIVEAVGPGVTRVRPGDHVLPTFIATCGACRQCRRGKYTYCETGLGIADGSMLDGTFRMHSDGQDIGTGSRLGSFSHFTVSPQNAVVVVPDDVDLVTASLISCGVSTGMGASINVAKVMPGDSVAVFGVGGVGMAALVGAVIAGAAEVVAVDVTESKLVAARTFGATSVVDASRGDAVEQIRAITNGYGVDKAVLCIDTVRPEHIAAAVDSLDSGGTAVVVGGADTKVDHIPISPAQFMRNSKALKGTLYGGMNPHADVLRYLELFRTGRLPLERFVTATYPLEDINDGFADMLSGKNVRGVVVYD
jgi:NDMA-dependent alcohol dehydrogenase